MILDVPWGAELVLDSIPLISKISSDYAAPTLAPGDVKVVKDGGAAANVTTLPTQAPGSSTHWRLTLSATEMEARVIAVDFVDQTSPAEFEQQRVWISTELVRGYLSFTVQAGSPTTTAFPTNLPGGDDAYLHAFVKFNTGANAGLVRPISAFVDSTGILTVSTAFPTAPSVGDKGVIINK